MPASTASIEENALARGEREREKQRLQNLAQRMKLCGIFLCNVLPLCKPSGLRLAPPFAPEEAQKLTKKKSQEKGSGQGAKGPGCRRTAMVKQQARVHTFESPPLKIVQEKTKEANGNKT